MITIAVGVGENKNILEACDIFKTQKPDVNMELIENDEKNLPKVFQTKI